MPGWTITGSDWGDPTKDPTAAAIYNQLCAAIWERQGAASQGFWGSIKTVNGAGAGSDIQTHVCWKELQEALEEVAPQFVDSHNNPGGFEGYAGLRIPNYTLAGWRTAIGLTGAGFRRVTGANWPANWENHADPAFSHGLAAATDMPGPWIMRDLQEGIDLLLWNKQETGDWNWITDRDHCLFGSAGSTNRNAGIGTSFVSWAAACTAAEANYNSGMYNATVEEWQPQAWYVGYYEDYDNKWTAGMQRAQARIELRWLSFGLRTRDIDFYLFSAAHNPDPVDRDWTYDLQGDVGLVEDTHHIFQTMAGVTPGASPASVDSNIYGQLTLPPNRPPAPDGPEAADVFKGYYTSDDNNFNSMIGLDWYPYFPKTRGTALHRWNRAGGFTYY